VDLHEGSENDIVNVIFELPGISKDHVRFEVRDRLLIVSAEIQSSTEHEGNGYTIREPQFGKFTRSLRLSGGINVIHFHRSHLLLASKVMCKPAHRGRLTEGASEMNRRTTGSQRNLFVLKGGLLNYSTPMDYIHEKVLASRECQVKEARIRRVSRGSEAYMMYSLQD
jgi:hypothetical protein